MGGVPGYAERVAAIIGRAAGSSKWAGWSSADLSCGAADGTVLSHASIFSTSGPRRVRVGGLTWDVVARGGRVASVSWAGGAGHLGRDGRTGEVERDGERRVVGRGAREG